MVHMSMVPPNRPSSLDPGFQITRETDIGKFEPSLAMAVISFGTDL